MESTSLSAQTINLALIAALTVVAVVCGVAYRWRKRLSAWGAQAADYFSPPQRPGARLLWPLFLVSFAGLYIEIMLIRWLGTEVRVFAYFQNLALISCFLGFGLGCYFANRRRSVFWALASMTALVVLAELPLRYWKGFLAILSKLLGLSSDASLWGALTNLPPKETLFLLFVASVVTVTTFLLLLVAVMIPLGQWVGYAMDAVPHPVTAYSVNLLGSVAGIWIFAGMAFLWLPPAVWFAVAAVLLLIVRPPGRRLVVASLVLLAIMVPLLVHKDTLAAETFWSPYQKLDVYDVKNHEYQINVNNTGYMVIANATPEFIREHPALGPDYPRRSSYDAPFSFARARDRVLIVGAGAGNDAAAALRNGATQVDTVEIDPVIYSLGERLHPEEPYRSSRVRKILNDARAYMQEAQEKYDVIVFGLLDSHTQFSDLSNMRVDSYVYTEEAFREARRLLRPGGILVVKFEVRAPWTWMGQRFYAMLSDIFGGPPVAFYAPQIGALVSATVFVTSDDPELWTRASTPELSALVRSQPPDFPLTAEGAPPNTTDDWPYLYHRGHTIPGTYLTVSLILLALALVLTRRVIEPGRASTWHFFFLGAGFLLLETQLISRLALYFGTTWLVNCIAITAILLVLVAANLYVTRVRPARLTAYYVLLLASLLANYIFPWHTLAHGARAVGLLLSLAYSLPVFCAGVIFTETFQRCERKSSAFGANIVGAVAGGLAQNVSFMVGMKALLLVAALFYLAAWVCGIFESAPRKVAAPSEANAR